MKIPFDIKYRSQIESGEYKVVDKDNHNVRIICWNKKSEKQYGYHIVGLVEFGPNHEESTYYTIDGKARLGDKHPYLFIITPEPELTEFEQYIDEVVDDAIRESTEGGIKAITQKILAIAKKELCNGCAANLEGYIKGRQDALKEMEENWVYKYEGPYMPTYYPCPHGGNCTNPFRDCINCPHHSTTIGITTTTGTSTAKVEG